MSEELKKLNINEAAAATDPLERITGSVTQATSGGTTKVREVVPVVHSGRISPVVFILVILLGLGSGFGLFKLMPGGNPQTSGVDETGQVAGGIKVGDIVGNADEKTFRDTAEGVIERGTSSGEGSHSLVREGGPSKTANLTSSVIDLDQFVGHRVQIWGETFSAQKSGWLMDVGRIKVIELNAPKPE